MEFEGLGLRVSSFGVRSVGVWSETVEGFGVLGCGLRPPSPKPKTLSLEKP